MEWYNQLLMICEAKKLEPIKQGDVLHIVGSTIPSKDTQAKIKAIIPKTMPVKYITGPKSFTINKIVSVLRMAGSTVVDIAGTLEGILLIKEAGIPVNHPAWDEVERIALSDAYINDVRKEEVELPPMLQALKSVTDTLMKQPSSDSSFTAPINPITDKLSTEIEKNREKGDYIQKNDITDLKIALGKAQTIDEFLEAI